MRFSAVSSAVPLRFLARCVNFLASAKTQIVLQFIIRKIFSRPNWLLCDKCKEIRLPEASLKNSSEIPPFSGSRNGLYKDIFFSLQPRMAEWSQSPLDQLVSAETGWNLEMNDPESIANVFRGKKLKIGWSRLCRFVYLRSAGFCQNQLKMNNLVFMFFFSAELWHADCDLSSAEKKR